MFPSDVASAVCAEGSGATVPVACTAGPEAGAGGCEQGAAAAARCIQGAAAGSKCVTGTCFD